MTASVTTRSFDVARSGANTAETVLTPAVVKARGVRQRWFCKRRTIPGWKRSRFTSPARRSGESRATSSFRPRWEIGSMPGMPTRARHSGKRIWVRQSTNRRRSTRTPSTSTVHWGILSAPVSDQTAARLYTCYWSSHDGDCTTGSTLKPPRQTVA
jgi:hypothetical protein